MTDSRTAKYDIGALLPGVGVFGGVRRFLALGNELVSRGHRFTLYHTNGEPPNWLPFAGVTRPLAALSAARHEVLLCGEPSLLAAFEAASAALKLFYCVLEKLPNERRLVRHPGWVVLANSTGIRDRLWRRHRVRAEPAIGGVDLDLFRPMEPRPFTRLEPFRVLAYGRLSRPRKGTALVVRAVESLADSLRKGGAAGGRVNVQPVQLVLFDHVGPGNERDPRPNLRARVPVEFHVNLAQPGLAQLYSSCDVFVSAERRAGWNNTVAEAMACGLPVVCTASGTRDLAVHLETAWLARWRQPFFLTRGLSALHRDPALRGRLRAAALARVQGFGWPAVADQIEAVIRSRLDPSRSRPESPTG